MSTYAHSAPFDDGYLQVSNLHRVHYAQYGNPDGKPVIFLHGGPGGGTSLSDTRYFSPAAYRVVLIDQRGAGLSTPAAETRENTTQDLIADIELLRTKLGIERWAMVFGGSWGSTLSLAYVQACPESVKGATVVLRGVFLGMEWEFDWTLRGAGSAVLFPDAWAEFVGYLPECERSDVVEGYRKVLLGEDRRKALDAAKAWNKWELSISTLSLAEGAYDKLADEEWNLQHALTECHYFVNGCFLRGDKALLNAENIKKMEGLDVHIVQGRYDVVCPPKAAWALHKALPSSALHWTVAGHSAAENDTQARLVQICDHVAKR